MSLSARIFIAYALFIIACSYFLTRTVMDEIRPGVRQTTEETLVDTANLLAEILRDPVKNGALASSQLADNIARYGQRQLNANIWGFAKTEPSHRIYVTDANGIVLLDSHQRDVGQDYSRWNDVYLTLRGRYGVRSTQETIGNTSASVMYVAAPIVDGANIIGVVSVAKPSRTVQPFIDRTQRRLGLFAALIAVLGLAIGAAFAWWLSRELRSLRRFATAVSQGERALLPRNQLRSRELQHLADALESMRRQLDGKAYVEHYVQSFAHELKGPLAGICAAAELLQSPMPAPQQQRFLHNVQYESQRLEQLIERLLQLAAIEQQQAPLAAEPFAVQAHLEQLLEVFQARLELKNIELRVATDSEAMVTGEPLLLRQAISNLLDNAIAFTPFGGTIRVSVATNTTEVVIGVANSGPQIPDYALPRLTERFFSLPRPDTGKKSTGLGLNFVQEVAHLHAGGFTIGNCADGVAAELRLPR